MNGAVELAKQRHPYCPPYTCTLSRCAAYQRSCKNEWAGHLQVLLQEVHIKQAPNITSEITQ